MKLQLKHFNILILFAFTLASMTVFAQVPTRVQNGAGKITVNSDGSITITPAAGKVTTIGGFSAAANTMIVAAVFAGNNGQKIAAAIDVLPAAGGTVDARSLPSGTLSGFTIDKPTVLLLGDATLTLGTAQTITVSKNLVVLGQRNASKVLAANGRAIFTLTDTFVASGESSIVLDGATFDGGEQAGSRLLDASALSVTSSFNESKFLLNNCVIQKFRSMAILLPVSFYYSAITHCWFRNNFGGSVLTGRFADILYDDDVFFNPGASPHITTYGSSTRIVNTDFIPAAASTGEDVLIKAGLSYGDGYIWINGCKFGPELETVSRYKIRVQADDPAYVVPTVHLVDNQFFGIAGQTAIDLETPIQGWIVQGNTFKGFQNIFRDAQPLTSALESSNSVFLNNSVEPEANDIISPNYFINGGRGFRYIQPLGHATLQSTTTQPRDNETPQLTNRLQVSEALDNTTFWNLIGGGSVAVGQLDPYGTTRATLLTRAGAVGSESLYSAPISTLNLGQTLYMKLWAKRSTLTTVTFSLYDMTTGGVVSQPVLPLDTNWRQFLIPVNGLDITHNYRVQIYPGTVNQVAGSIYLFGLQVSDHNSDYIPTAGAAFVDSTAGNRFEKRAIFASGLYASGDSIYDASRTFALQVKNKALNKFIEVGYSDALDGGVITSGQYAVANKNTYINPNGAFLRVGSAVAPAYPLDVDGGFRATGNILFSKTVTPAGVTGAQTINSPTGSVNFAAGDTSLVVTDSYIGVGSIIQCTVGTNDATMKGAQCVAGSGFLTIYPNATPTGETRVNFSLTN
jgi:hypothetical protein